MRITYSIDFEAIRKLCPHQIAIITDDTVADRFGKKWAHELNALLLTLEPSEKSKTLKVSEKLIDQLLENGCGKDTTIIALGGGVVTDLAGFIASIVMRGLPLILVPTTLLAMVDAAIGGKTALDTAYGKNLIGTNYPPKHIFIDPIFLQDLPEDQWQNGLAEVLKLGLVYDKTLWKRAQKERTLELIQAAIDAKMEVVEKDPLEQGLRRILNFGHTIGHALEKSFHYTMAHGEAVAIGCVAESYLSRKLGLLSKEEFEEIFAVFSNRKLPSKIPEEAFLRAILTDKKNRLGKVQCVLLEGIGKVYKANGAYVTVIDEPDLLSTLNWMQTCFA